MALHCVVHAPCSVLVVHGAAPSTGAAAGTVVVGLDDSHTGRAALSAAVSEAARLGAEVEAVVAHRPPDHWIDLPSHRVPPAGETDEHALARGEKIVAEVLGAPSEGTASEGRLPSVRVVAESGPAAPILLAHAEGAALLVVGCRSRSRIAGMVLGSVALDCVVNAHSPVMVVRPPHGSRHPVGG